MKIAQIAPIWTKIPPGKFGGTETLISYLTEGLVKKGHDVTLFATGDSVTKAKLLSPIDKGLLEKGLSFNSDYYWVLYHILEVLKRKKEFDILHFHLTNKFDYIAMGLVRNEKHVLFTSHMPLLTASSKTSGNLSFLQKIFLVSR